MADTDTERAAEGFYMFVAQQMAAGASRAQVEAALVEKGLDEQTAAAVVADVARLRRNVARAAGRRSILIGLFWIALAFLLRWLMPLSGGIGVPTLTAIALALVGMILIGRGAARFLE